MVTLYKTLTADVAQLVEFLTSNQIVVGSSPIIRSSETSVSKQSLFKADSL